MKNIRQLGGREDSFIREIIREELAAALAKENAEIPTEQEGDEHRNKVGYFEKEQRKQKYSPRGKSKMLSLPVNNKAILHYVSVTDLVQSCLQVSK